VLPPSTETSLITSIGFGITVSVSLAADVFDTPCAVLTPPTGIVLVCDPSTEEVTVTVTLHARPARRVAPDKLTLVPPSKAVTEPFWQVVEPFAGVALIISTG
jgi:hypothetical protein